MSSIITGGFVYFSDFYLCIENFHFLGGFVFLSNIGWKDFFTSDDSATSLSPPKKSISDPSFLLDTEKSLYTLSFQEFLKVIRNTMQSSGS